MLPFFGKRKHVMKMTFLVYNYNASVNFIGSNAISRCLHLSISQQDECLCSKLDLDVEDAKFNQNHQ